MKIVSPSMLSADFCNLEKSLEEVRASGAPWVHLDVMDGLFVPNISFGMPVVAAMRKHTDLVLDVHLMIDRPLRYVEEFKKAGADWLTVHLESDFPENIEKTLKKIRELGMKAGLSVKPGTPVEMTLPFLPLCDMVLVMTVEPGFGGQKFMENQMEKLRWLRQHCAPETLLQVDGGVDRKTASVCTEAGADVLVSGSSFFKDQDKADYVLTLSSL